MLISPVVMSMTTVLPTGVPAIDIYQREADSLKRAFAKYLEVSLDMDAETAIVGDYIHSSVEFSVRRPYQSSSCVFFPFRRVGCLSRVRSGRSFSLFVNLGNGFTGQADIDKLRKFGQ